MNFKIHDLEAIIDEKGFVISNFVCSVSRERTP